MRLVKTPMTLEQYEAKYPHHQTKLMSFSDNEIKEFNNKFYKNNGNKNIPDKYALLNKYKWVHIKDRYYQIPRVSKLGKAGICVLAAGVVATGAALPFVLKPNATDVNLTEEEFKSSLSYFYTKDVNRKYSATYKIEDLDPKLNGGEDKEGSIEVDGVNIKNSYNDPDDPESPNKTYYYKLFGANNTLFKSKEKDTSTWSRVVLKENDPIYKKFGYALETFSNNFSKFTHSKNVYSCTDIEYEEPEDINGGGGGKYKLSADLTFNSDKTLKKLHQISVEVDPKNGGGGGESKDSLDVDFTEIGSHEFHDIDDVTPKQIENLIYNEYANGYTSTIKNMSGGEFETIVEVEYDGSHPFQKFYIESSEKNDDLYPLAETEIQAVLNEQGLPTSYSFSENTITLTSPIQKTGGKLTIKLKFSEDSDDEWRFVAKPAA